MYSRNRYFELHGQINHHIGSSGIGKDQLDKIIESICRSFRTHDEIEMQKLAAWAAKPKKEREESKKMTVALYFPPANTTKPATPTFMSVATIITAESAEVRPHCSKKAAKIWSVSEKYVSLRHRTR